MNEKEIRKKIRANLESSKTGILNKQLMGRIGIVKRKASETHYYKALDDLKDEGIIDREKRVVKGQSIIYLPKYKEDTWNKWNLYEKQIQIELENIICGFLLIKQGVFKQRKGSLLPYLGHHLYDEKLVRSGMLNRFVDVDDKSDFLYFWVENRNNHAIEGIESRIKVSPLFYEPMVPREKDCCKCKYNSNYTDITITCERLLPWVKQMPNDRAYILIPLMRKSEHLMNDDERHEMMPIVKVWYKDVRIKKIKGGEVTSDTSKSKYIFEIG